MIITMLSKSHIVCAGGNFTTKSIGVSLCQNGARHKNPTFTYRKFYKDSSSTIRGFKTLNRSRNPVHNHNVNSNSR